MASAELGCHGAMVPWCCGGPVLQHYLSISGVVGLPGLGGSSHPLVLSANNNHNNDVPYGQFQVKFLRITESYFFWIFGVKNINFTN